MFNKKAQLGETLTWIVATVIIVVTLIVFIFISSQLAKTKNTPAELVKTGINLKNYFFDEDIGQINRIDTKTYFAYSLLDKNKEQIDNWIKNEK